jgi:RHS repeat-associated protein
MMESVMEVSSPRSYDASNRIAAAGVAYDAAGDMTRDGKHRYEFDAERRISQVDGGAAEYLYSAEGDRIEKRVGDEATETIWVGNDPIAELKPDGTWVDYLYLDGRRVAAIGKSDATYYVADPLGMARMELSSTGDILTQSDMTPFGQLINRHSDADQVPFTGGEKYDAESGLYSYKYRSYNPQLGRWMSPDPSDEEFARVSNPQSLNLYSYVINDPLKYVDQLGLAGGSGGSCSLPKKVNCAGNTTLLSDNVRIQADTTGQITSIGIPLTGDSQYQTTTETGVVFQVQPNTIIGITLNPDKSLSVSFNNPIYVSSIGYFFGGYVTSLTFSQGVFTQVNGSVSFLGIHGSTSTPSSILLEKFNNNSTVINTAQLINNSARLAQSVVGCTVGGQP